MKSFHFVDEEFCCLENVWRAQRPWSIEPRWSLFHHRRRERRNWHTPQPPAERRQSQHQEFRTLILYRFFLLSVHLDSSLPCLLPNSRFESFSVEVGYENPSWLWRREEKEMRKHYKIGLWTLLLFVISGLLQSNFLYFHSCFRLNEMNRMERALFWPINKKHFKWHFIFQQVSWKVETFRERNRFSDASFPQISFHFHDFPNCRNHLLLLGLIDVYSRDFHFAFSDTLILIAFFFSDSMLGFDFILSRLKWKEKEKWNCSI